MEGTTTLETVPTTIPAATNKIMTAITTPMEKVEIGDRAGRFRATLDLATTTEELQNKRNSKLAV